MTTPALSPSDVIKRKQENRLKIAAIRARIESRLIKLATPTELMQVARLVRANDVLQKDLVRLVDAMVKDHQQHYPLYK